MDEVLRGLCRGQVAHRVLPHRLAIWHLAAGLGDLKAEAFRDGIECGACLAMEDGHLVLVHWVRGEVDQVSPCCSRTQPPHQDYIGFVHVHLPLPGIGTYAGFSDRDFRGATADGANLSLVTNGDEVFALARAADCTAAAQVIPEEECRGWRDKYAAALAGLPDSIDRQLLRVNRELCGRLGFAFYRGRWGEPLELIYPPAPGGTI
jgi:hypothetical protein